MREREIQLKPQVYLDERPSEYFQSLYEYASTHRPPPIKSSPGCENSTAS